MVPSPGAFSGVVVRVPDTVWSVSMVPGDVYEHRAQDIPRRAVRAPCIPVILDRVWNSEWVDILPGVPRDDCIDINYVRPRRSYLAGRSRNLVTTDKQDR